MIKGGFCLLELSLYFLILSLHYFLNEFIFIKLFPIQTVLSSGVLGECHTFGTSLTPTHPPHPQWWLVSGHAPDSIHSTPLCHWLAVVEGQSVAVFGEWCPIDCFPNPARTYGPGCFIHSGSNLVIGQATRKRVYTIMLSSSKAFSFAPVHHG